MFPHRLNLLPPDKKKHLKKMINFQFFKTIAEIFLIFLSVTGIVLLGSQWVLEDYYSQLTEHIFSISERHSNTNNIIKEINNNLVKVEKIQKEYINWTPLILEITEAIPANVKISKININQKNELTINGLANNRRTLLDLQKTLEEITWLEDFTIPPAQLTEKENINFSFVIPIKL